MCQHYTTAVGFDENLEKAKAMYRGLLASGCSVEIHSHARCVCENRGYMTNTTRAFAHSPFAPALGSVLDGALLVSNGYSLWLEHVIEKSSNAEVFWLMWYDPNGLPTIPLSGIFDKSDLELLIGRLTTTIPP